MHTNWSKATRESKRTSTFLWKHLRALYTTTILILVVTSKFPFSWLFRNHLCILLYFFFFLFLSFFNIFKRKREKKGRTIPLFRSVRCHQDNRSFVAVRSILRFFHRSLSNDASHYAFRCSRRNCERPLAWFRSRRVFHCNLETLPRRATVERAARVT